jgi:thiol-disulfide isomerase/thioredoxin
VIEETNKAGPSRAEASGPDPADGQKPDGDEVATVTISGRAMLGVLLAVVVAVSGIVVGSRIMGSATESAAAPAEVPPVATAAPVADSRAGGVTTGERVRLPVGPDGEISPGSVIDLGESTHPLIGTEPIEIEGELLDGQRAKVSDYIGQPLLINFWATWCPPCRIEMPWLEEAYQKYQEDEFVILAVDAGERVPPSMVKETVADFAASLEMTFPVLLPDDPYGPQREYRVYGLPSSYLVNRDGVIVDVHRGMFPNRVTLDAALQSIVGDQ